MGAALKLVDPQVTRQRCERAISEAIDHLGAGRRPQAAARLADLAPAGLSHAHCSLIGRILTGAADHESALRWFDHALAIDPAFPEALAGRATALDSLERLAEAVPAYEAALQAGVRDAEVVYRFGTVLDRLKRPDEALAAFDVALKLRPGDPETLRAAGRILQGMGQVAGALRLFDEAIAQAPQANEPVLDRANLLREQERMAEALATYDAAVLRMPEHALLWNNRGMALHDLGRMDEALQSLDEALRLDAALAQAHLNRGNVLVRLNRQDESIAAYDRAISLRPAYPQALSSRGLALKMLGRFDEARLAFDESLRHDPGFIYALANRGELNLLLGRFEPGWPEYEFRFFTERQTKPALKVPTPEWQGPGRRDARIVVFADQGSGDCLQFSRFLPAATAEIGHVTFVCAKRLQRVLRAVTATVSVREAVADDEAFDYQITLSSMPTAFGTNLETLASSKPYLSAEPGLIRHWAPRIGTAGLKVGLCWRGSQTWQCDPNRSVPFGDLAPLAGVPDIRLFSLQMPDNSERAGGAHRLPVDDLSGELDRGGDAFIDTAAVMANLDLVITCDTSIAHLAGALGRPVWVLIQAVPEWRWLLGRDTSPWYPSMRLFRQSVAGNWAEPIARMVEALHRFEPAPLTQA